MALYTTLFLARLDALAAGFPGWKLPLATPVQRTVRNPFTGTARTITTVEPEWPEDVAEPQPPQVVAIEGDYGAYLEARLPPLVRASAHWATKGLSDIELRALVEASGSEGSLQAPLYAPPSAGAMLQTLPEGFGAWSEATVVSTARRWAAELSTPHHTHSTHGKRVKPDFPEADARVVIDLIVALARRGRPGERMLLLTEW